MKTLYSTAASICIAFVFFLAWSCSNRPENRDSAFRFLTPDVSVVIYTQQPVLLTKKLDSHPLYATVKSTPIVKDLSRDVEVLRLLVGDSVFHNSANNPVVGGLVLTGARQYGWIFLVRHPSERLSFKEDTSIFSVTSTSYEGRPVYHVRSRISNAFYISEASGIVIVSRHQELVEEALRTYDGAHALDDESGFREAFKTINKKDPVNILVNMKEFAALTQVMLPKTSLSWMKSLGRWCALDVDFSEPLIRADGLIQVPDSQGYYFSVLAQNTLGEKKISHLPIPGFADGLVHINLGNYATFYRKYTEYLEQNGQLIKHNRSWESEFASIPKSAVLELLRPEFGYFVTRSENLAERVYYFRMTDVGKASELMQIKKNGVQPLKYRDYLIYEMNKPGILQMFFGKFVSLGSGAFYTTIGDFLVVAENESVLYTCINAWEDGTLLTKDKSFEELMSKSSQTGHIIAFSKNSYFEKSTARQLGKKFENTRQLLEQKHSQHLALLQINYLNQNAYVSVVYGGQPTEKQPIRQLWTLKNTDITFGPKAVVNHLNQSHEIIYQDSKGILHVLSPEGTPLWSKQLDAPIVYSTQWDMYKNGRLQHVIVTKKSIYVLDRNGNDVKPWPMKLQGNITAAALMDYENTKNYRLLVGEGNTLHNLDKEAKAVKGWQLSRLSAPLAFEPKLYQFQGRDYLLFQLQDGSVWVTDRTGVSRVQGKFPYVTQQQVQLVFPTDGKPWYVTHVKPNGEQIHAFQNGKTDSIRLLQGADFGYLAHNGDFMGYAYGTKVIVKDRNVFFEKKLPFAPTEAPARYMWNNSVLYAIVSSSDEKISILHTDGSTAEGFPLFGSTLPLMVKTTVPDQVLIVTQSNQGHLIAYAMSDALLRRP